MTPTDLGITPAQPTCIACVRKHLAMAKGFADEMVMGYPHHYWYGLGQMGLAESEAVEFFPELAEMIRAARKQWEANPVKLPDFKALLYASDGDEVPSSTPAWWAKEMNVLREALQMILVVHAGRTS